MTLDPTYLPALPPAYFCQYSDTMLSHVECMVRKPYTQEDGPSP